MDTKVCTACKKVKPVADFHKFGRGTTKVGKWCEACYTRIKGTRKTQPMRDAPV